jgi:ubiquinone/menaquinone biosynthesis C-methylase UbiE
MPDAWYFPDEFFRVVECAACGLGFVNPRPTFSEIGRYYPSEFFDGFERDAAFHLERYKREAAYLRFARTPSDGVPKLLDVGCANGGFARQVQSMGWEVEGVEVSSNALNISEFPVYRCPLPEIPVDSERYDAVTAWAVLEHVHDPMAYFKAASRILKKQGVFIFLVTNFESITSRYLFREDVPRHLYFFSQKTIERYLESCGLSLEYSVSDNSIYSLRPVNWLRFFARRWAGKLPLPWDKVPESRQDYFKRLRREPSWPMNIRYALTHPITTLDRILLPLYEKFQMMTGSYCISIYVARKK